jgi:Ser/Thr protein kinase RdoA (MazF antagonist)
MEQAIRDRYNDNILHQVQQRYDISNFEIEPLHGFESFLYVFRKNDSELVLRITHSLRRSVNLIRGEVDWINYLYQGGVNVARAVPSADGNLVEIFDDDQGGQFLAAAFVKAPGNPPGPLDHWRKDFIVRYGSLLGRMHGLSKHYRPATTSWRRPQWDDPLNLEVLAWLPADQPRVAAEARHIVDYLQTLPQDREVYGLIHQDAHAGNFHVDDTGSITLFDFDDAVYSWFIYDIAMVIFYAVTNHPDPPAAANRLWPSFWHGYCRENYLNPDWLVQIPAFMKLREIDLYAAIHRSFDVAALADGWVVDFMAGRRQRIENRIPYLEYEFTIPN